MLGAGRVRAVFHTHRLETGAGALGVLNYAIKATDQRVKGDEHVPEPGKQHREIPPTSTFTQEHTGSWEAALPEYSSQGLSHRVHPHAPHFSCHQHLPSDSLIFSSKSLVMPRRIKYYIMAVHITIYLALKRRK